MTMRLPQPIVAALVAIAAACGGKPSAGPPVPPSEPTTEETTNSKGTRTHTPTLSRDRAAVAEFIKSAEAAAKKKVTKGTLKLPSEFCRRRTKRRGPLRECTMRVLGLASAALLELVLSCEYQPCNRTWYLVLSKAGPREHKGWDLGDGVAVAPQARYAVAGSFEPNYAHGKDTAKLLRIDLDTGASETFVDGCTAPVLSPGGKWFVCRGGVGDVYRVPVTGKPTLRHVYKVKNPKRQSIFKTPNGALGLAPVEFVGGKMSIKTTWEDMSRTTDTTPWAE